MQVIDEQLDKLEEVIGLIENETMEKQWLDIVGDYKDPDWVKHVKTNPWYKELYNVPPHVNKLWTVDKHNDTIVFDKGRQQGKSDTEKALEEYYTSLDDKVNALSNVKQYDSMMERYKGYTRAVQEDNIR